MLSFKLLSFDFLLKETVTLFRLLVKTIHCKTENDIGKYYYRCSQKNLQKFQQFQIPAVFSFHKWQYWISSGPSLLKKILSTTNKLSVMASLYNFKIKINAKLQEKTLARWDMSIHHEPTVSSVNFQSQSFVFNVLISWHGRFKAIGKTSLRMSWNYQN